MNNELYRMLHGFIWTKTKIYMTYKYTEVLLQITDEDKEQFDGFMCYTPEQFDSSKIMQFLLCRRYLVIFREYFSI